MEQAHKIRTLFAIGMGLILLLIPSFDATAATLDSMRAEVISSDLRAAMAENTSSEYSVMVTLEGEAYDAHERQLMESNNARSSLETATLDEIQEQIRTQRAQSSAFYQAQNQSAIEGKIDAEDIDYISKFSPIVFASMDAGEVNRLALNSQVESISYLGGDEIVILPWEEEEVSSSIAMTRSVLDTCDNYLSEIHASVLTNRVTGDGVKVGIVEKGIPSEDYRHQLNISSSHLWLPDGRLFIDDHSAKVISVFNQMAPDTEIYIASLGFGNSLNNQRKYYVQAIEWLIESGVNVINMSWGLGSNTAQQQLNAYTSDSIWMDHVSICHNVSFVVAAGNYGADGVCSTSMAYNSIAVGKVTTTGERWIDASDASLSSSYNSMLVSTATKPDICAPGADYIDDGNIDTGTSFSAPQVAGVIALMMEYRPFMLTRPEAVKAMLCANTNSDYAMHTTERTSTNPYAEYGAGVIDCRSLYTSLLYMRYFYNTSVAVPANTTLSYSIELTKMVDTRIALVYSKYIVPGELGCSIDEPDYSDMTPYDLTHIELEVWVDGEKIAYSDNYSNNVKILSVYSDEQVTATVKIVFKEATTHTTELTLAWMYYMPN